MADELSPPPIPPFIDLRVLDYMPMKVRILRDSRVAAEAPPEVYRALTLLWCAAWHQVPAGSLPNNERELAVLSGVGHGKDWQALLDLAEAWKSGDRISKSVRRKTANGRETVEVSQSIVRRNSGVPQNGQSGKSASDRPAAGHHAASQVAAPWPLNGRIMALLDGWMMFADGRFYHPLISQLAVTSWNTYNTNKYSREYERNRKNNTERKARGEVTIKLTRPPLAKFDWPVDANGSPKKSKIDPAEYAGIPLYVCNGVDVQVAAGINLTGSIESTGRAEASSTKYLPESKNHDSEIRPAIEMQFVPPSVNEQITDGRRKPTAPKTGIAAKELEATEMKREVVTGEVWKAYADAYFLRYGTEPLRNATVNSQLKLFVQRVGREQAPTLASFYVTLNTRFYVEKMHSVGPMVRDAESIFAQFKTGTRMTSGKAAAVDRAQTTQAAFQHLIADAEGKD